MYFVIYFVDVLVCDQYLDNKTQKSNLKVCCHLSVTPACSHVCSQQVDHRTDSFGPAIFHIDGTLTQMEPICLPMLCSLLLNCQTDFNAMLFSRSFANKLTYDHK